MIKSSCGWNINGYLWNECFRLELRIRDEILRKEVAKIRDNMNS
ncbi:hypothetical protein [Clostridium tertium]|nr:hypothetical protein [Clostridium tertium]